MHTVGYWVAMTPEEPTPTKDQNTAEQSRDRESRLKQERLFNKVTSVMTVTVGAVSVAFALLTSLPTSQLANSTDKLASSFNRVEKEVDGLHDQVESLLKLAQSGPTDLKTRIALAAMNNEITQLKAQVNAFQISLGTDLPQRVALPILRHDLDALKESQTTAMASLIQEMNRTFDLMKWLLGIVGTSIIVGGLSSYFSRQKPNI